MLRPWPYNETMEDIAAFLKEDLGAGDVTTDTIVPADHVSEAVIIAKEPGILAGQAFAREVFETLHSGVVYTEVGADGASLKPGETVAVIKGRTRAILSGERLALNILQRLSGIATLTRKFVDAVTGTGAKILDTRKTTPGLRLMEKYAVRMGGGYNHRFDLSEMALIKENHVAAAGSIEEAVRRIRKSRDVFIEVEVRDLDELEQALAAQADRIMLDNWKTEDMRKAVSLARKIIPLEASGNMSLERVREVAETGVDFISVGSITHSFRSLDMSLLIHRG